MMEIWTIGGGEYIVNVFNAVSAWTGGGGFRSLIRVVMVMGLIYSLLVVAFSLNWHAWLNWFLGATLMYGALIVPTTTVKVTDRLNPGLAPATVANVPVGLALIASVSSRTGDWLTETAETVFVMPGSLQMSNNGMIYGARLWDRTREFKIRDPRISANLEEYYKQCLFYDILLGFESFDAIATSNDILTDMGPGSPARGMKWIPDAGAPTIVTCQAGYTNLQTGLITYADTQLEEEGRKMFPGLTPATARAKLVADLPAIANQFHGSSQTAQQIFHQRSLVSAFLEARANLGAADGDTFAMLRAEEQARNTYTSIAQQAMTWVPLLNIVLTVVFYAMFPVIFPLFLIPRTGVSALKGYFTGFFYLAAWGPLYVVLHMFIMDRASDALNATSPGGITMAGMAGIDAVNADTATIAGFLMMSIPFLAAGMARGAMAVSSQATSMLAPAQSAAEAAAVERTTGNYSYGNENFMNLSGFNRQSDQWNTAPNYQGGMARTSYREADGAITKGFADGSSAFDTSDAISNLAFRPTRTAGFAAEARGVLSEGWGRVEQARQSASESWGATASTATELFNSAERYASSSTQTGSGFNNSLTNMYEASNAMSNDLQSRFGMSQSDADRIARSSTMTGSADASLGVPGGALTGVNAKLAAQIAASASRETGRTVTADEAWSELRGYVERQSSSVQARQAREDFMRETSTAQDSETRGLSQRLGASITDSRSASLEASQTEDTWRRISRDVSNAESRGFNLNYNETQEFVRYAEDELQKPENAVLRDIGWRPNMVAPTAQQEGVRDIMLGRYMDSRIDRMRDELGLVPDAPRSLGIDGPAITTGDGVRAWGNANQARLEGRAPDVNVRASSRDSALADDVAGRVEYGEERILDGGRDLRQEGVGSYRGASGLRETVDQRNHASLGRTMPIVSPLMDKIDEFTGSFGSGGQPGSGASSLLELPRGQQPLLPVAGAAGSGLGTRVDPISGERRQHNGLDIPAAAGTPVIARGAGVVSKVEFQAGGAGNYVVIDHPDGTQSKYFHMQSRSPLEEGQSVSAGQQIGQVGSTGRSTGPHLHYELWRDGQPVDPRRFGFR